MEDYNFKSDGKAQLGEYKWLTYSEVDDMVEALVRSMKRKELCPKIKSNCEGTPDMKFLGIFSENCK